MLPRWSRCLTTAASELCPALPLLPSAMDAPALAPRVCVVTRANFQATLPVLQATLRSASFVAIDCEMSGLSRERWLMGSSADTLDSRWARVRDSGLHLGLLQYGLCAFEWCPAQQAFLARPFSFHLLPSPVGGLEPRVDSSVAGAGGEAGFHASVGALEFLRDNKFSFSALVQDGLTFLSRTAEVQLRHLHRMRALRAAAKGMQAAEEAGALEQQGGADAAAAATHQPLRIVIDLPKSPAELAAAAAAAAAAATPAATTAAATAASGGGMADTAPAAKAAAAPAAANEIRINRPEDAEWYARVQTALEEWLARVEAWKARGGASAPVDAADMASSPAVDMDPPLETFPQPAEGGSSSSSSSSSSMEVEGARPGSLSFPYLLLPPGNGFRRKIVHTLLEGRFGPSRLSPVRVVQRPGDTPAGTPYYETVQRLVWVGAGTAGMGAYEQCELGRAVGVVDAALDAALGFRKVIDAITASGVPVVGHNCWLDFSHTVAKFHGAPAAALPGFAAQLHSIFPTVYDTKHLLAAWKEVALDPVTTQAFFNNHSLGDAYRVVQRVSSVKVFLPSKETEGAAAAAPAAAAAAGSAAAAAAEPAAATATAATAAPAATATAKPAAGGWRAQKKLPQDRCDVTIDWPSLAKIVLPPEFDHSAAAAAAAAASGQEGAAPEAAGAFQETPHDAGYDAFMTGVVFARVAARLGGLSMPATAAAEGSSSGSACAPPPPFDPRTGSSAPPALATLFCSPPPYLSAAANTLYVMRTTRPAHTFLNLAHARALQAAGRQGASAPQPAAFPEDAHNTFLAARAAGYRGNYVAIGGLDVSIGDEAVKEALCRELGIEERMIRGFSREGAGCALVGLPTHEHAVAAVVASCGGGGAGGGEEEEASSAGSSDGEGGMVGGAGSSSSSGGGAASPATAALNSLGQGLSWIFQKLRGSGSGSGGGGGGEAQGKSIKRSRGEAEGSSSSSSSAAAAAAAGAAAAAASGAASGDYFLSHLPVSAFTPALVAQCVHPLRLADLSVQTYASWLKEHADVFGAECAHEVVPKVFAVAPPGAAEGGAAATAAAGDAAVAAPAKRSKAP